MIISGEQLKQLLDNYAATATAVAPDRLLAIDHEELAQLVAQQVVENLLQSYARRSENLNSVANLDQDSSPNLPSAVSAWQWRQEIIEMTSETGGGR